MTPAYAKKLGLRVRKTNVGAQKIDGSVLETYGMVIAGFQVQDKLGRARFFQETFLVADTSMEVVFGMPFLTLSNADVLLQKGNLPGGFIPLQRPYLPLGPDHRSEAFVMVAVDPSEGAFVVYVAALSVPMKNPLRCYQSILRSIPML